MDEQFLVVPTSTSTIAINDTHSYNNSKSLPPSPVLSTREQFNLTSRSQHSSPCIVSQQQAKDLLNSFHLKSKFNQDQEVIKNKDEASIVQEINGNNSKIIATPNSLKIINKVIERNKQSLSPLIISEGNPVNLNNNNNINSNNFNNNNNNNNNSSNNNNQQSPSSFDIEMSTINTLTESNENINNSNNSNSSDIVSNNGIDISNSNGGTEEAQVSLEQRVREERLNVLRFRIQNETLFKNYTKLNTAYGLVGMLTVFSTVFLFVKGFEKNPDNHILYVGIALSTLGFVVINHSIHIAYRRSRRNIDILQQEFMRVFDNNETTNNGNNTVDPSTIPSKLEKCTIDILSSPNLENPPQTPRMNGFSPIFNKLNTSPIFNIINTSPIFNKLNNNNNNNNNNSNNNSNNTSPKINQINNSTENDNNIYDNNNNNNINNSEVTNQDLNNSSTNIITNHIDINIIN